MVYGGFKDLPRRTIPDIKLCGIKHLTLQKIQSMIDVNVDLLQ